MSDHCSIETLCTHGDPDNRIPHPFGAVTMPVFFSTAYAHPGFLESTGYDYSRVSNPTRAELENTVTALEEGAGTVALSSGMAAITLWMELLPQGSHIVCSEDIYGGTIRLFENVGKNHGLSVTAVDTADTEAVEAAIRDNTAALFVETPGNPTMRVSDLRALKKICERHHLILAVDNTFLTPYFQKPLTLGADFVIHSGTKFLSGHNDVLAGFLTSKTREDAERVQALTMTCGSCLGPLDSYLALRGIKTLPLRMEKQQANAQKIAQWLKTRPYVKAVHYVGLPDDPGYALNRSQATGAGSMISFSVDTKERALRALTKVKLIYFAESLGGVESLLTYPATQTHKDVPQEIRERLGITDNFLRLSVGIEGADDLIRDLQQALED